MTLPSAVAETAITAITAALPELQECVLYPGRVDAGELQSWTTSVPSVRVALMGIDTDELQSWGANVPSVRVAFLGIPRFSREAAGYMDAHCRFAGYILADSQDGQELIAAKSAANIATALAVLIDRNDWGLDDVDVAEVTRIENLYSQTIDTKSLALWSVIWTQTVHLGEDIFGAADLASGGVVPSTIYVGQAPSIGADHVSSYTDVVTGEAPNV